MASTCFPVSPTPVLFLASSTPPRSSPPRCRRDLKLDNTLLDGHKPPWVKLCDFGFAKHWMQSSNMNTMRIGTPEYMGPELISSRWGLMCWWGFSKATVAVVVVPQD